MKASATFLVANLLVIKLPLQLECNPDNFFVFTVLSSYLV